MNNGAHVLVVGRDQMLLQTRALILGAYFQVEPAGRIPEAEAAMAKVNFDIVILCHSLSNDDYRKMLDLCKRQAPNPRILTLGAANNGHPKAGGDGEFTQDYGPYELLKKTAEMVGFHLKPKGRAAQS